MKMLAGMSQADIEFYMQSMADLVKSVTPPDAMFMLVVFGTKQGNMSGTDTHYICSARRLEMPTALRELANRLEARMAESN